MIFPPKGDAFAERNQYAMQVDFEEEPPFFKLSDTHYAPPGFCIPMHPRWKCRKHFSTGSHV